MLLILALPSVNGDQAAALVRETLAEFGYRRPLRLQRLSRYNVPGLPAPPFWHLEFTSSDGRTVTANVRMGDGRVTSLEVRTPPKPMRTVAATAFVFQKHADQLVDRLRGKRPVRFDSIRFGAQDTVFATYKLLIDGYPFVMDYGQAGYSVSFDAGTTEFRGFAVMDTSPPIDPRPARLSRAQADAKVRSYVETHVRGPFRRSGAKVGEPVYFPSEFGYHHVEGEVRARRVWKGNFQVDIVTPRRPIAGRQSVLIDAVTGEIVPFRI